MLTPALVYPWEYGVELGVAGAALATIVSRALGFFVVLGAFIVAHRASKKEMDPEGVAGKSRWESCGSGGRWAFSI